jgi:hypothetical protein
MFRRFRLVTDEYNHDGKTVGKGPVKAHIFSAADLVKYEFLEIPATAPERDRLEAEYSCENPRCEMREVEISMKGARKSAPALVCPACRERLKFHHFLTSVPLLPVEHSDQAATPRSLATAEPGVD